MTFLPEIRACAAIRRRIAPARSLGQNPGFCLSTPARECSYFVLMTRYWRGEINSLLDAVRARRMLWGLCRHCGHAERIDPRSLAYRYGAVLLTDIEAKLRCIRCNQRRGAVVADDEEWPRR